MALGQPDLWTTALNSLSDEDRQDIDFSSDKLTVLEDVYNAAQEKKQICMQKRWKFTKKNGQVVIVRDVCEKLVKWVNKFKEVGDVAVQYDPVHASLPWAAIRFILQLSISDVQTFGAMAEGLEKAAEHITLGCLYEQLYLSRQSAARSELEISLIRMYATTLSYLAKARHYYSKGTIRRIGGSLIDTPDSLIEQSLSRISEASLQVDRLARLIDAELLQHSNAAVDLTQTSVEQLADQLGSFVTDISNAQDRSYQTLKSILASLEQPILRAADQILGLHAKLQKAERRELLTWLSTTRYREHHKSSWSTVMSGSGAWLEQKQAFIEWKSTSSSSILWIHGIPGSGKSKLLTTIVQNLLDTKSNNVATSALAYFYCARDTAEPQRANPDEIMRTVLKQLSCFDAAQPVNTVVVCEYEKRKRDADEDGLEPLKLSIKDSKDLIIEIAEHLPIVIITDALDECDHRRRYELLHSLREIIQMSSNLVKILVSSRDDADIVCRLQDVPNVFISANDSSEDIVRFIVQEVEKAAMEKRLLNGRVQDQLKTHIIEKITTNAKGMFLWASLQIQNLCDPQRMVLASDVEYALDRLPPTLSQIYSTILDRIEGMATNGRKIAKTALRWLLCSQRPLSSDEFLDVLRIDGENEPLISRQDVLDLCGNYVIMDETFDRFRFAHASVRDFLESQSGFDKPETNALAAEECLTVVEKRDSNRPIINYARSYWINHYSSLGINFRLNQSVSIRIKAAFLRASVGSHSTSSAEHNTTIFKSIPTWPPSLELACKLGLLEIVEFIFERSNIHPDDVAPYNTLKIPGLLIASEAGHSQVVSMLLQKGANVDSMTRFGATALHVACQHGHYDIVRELLQHGANVAVKDRDGFTPLDWAAKGDHEIVLRLLIESGAQDEALRKYEKPILAWCHQAESGSEEIKKILHRPTGYIGIYNEGATGYLNAILQLLYTIRPFHTALSQMPLEIASRVSIAGAIDRLFSNLDKSTDIVSTKELTKSFGWEAEQLQEPQDPFEMWRLLLDHCLNSTEENRSLHQAFKDIFCFSVGDRCGYREPEEWFDLSLNVDRMLDLQASLDEWFRDKNPNPPYQEIERWKFIRLPPVFIQELKRYCFNMDTDSMEKASHLVVHDYFPFPDRFTLKQEQEPFEVKYVLHSVIVHRGDFSGGAKIFNFIKLHEKNRWIQCRNEQVIWATNEEVFEGTFGSKGKLEKPSESATASILVYLDESKLDELLRPEPGE